MKSGVESTRAILPLLRSLVRPFWQYRLRSVLGFNSRGTAESAHRWLVCPADTTGTQRMRFSMPGRLTLALPARRGRIIEQVVSACGLPLLCRAVRGAAPSDVRRHLGRGTGSVCEVPGRNLFRRKGDAQECI